MSGFPVRPLKCVAKVIRSKNAKPFRLTLDVLFDRKDVFDYVRNSGALTASSVAGAYGLQPDWVTSSFVFEPGLALKFTFRRPVTQGSFAETDIYGAQQHVPLLELPIPWLSDAPTLASDCEGSGCLHDNHG
jgi:hypothetical protein